MAGFKKVSPDYLMGSARFELGRREKALVGRLLVELGRIISSYDRITADLAPRHLDGQQKRSINKVPRTTPQHQNHLVDPIFTRIPSKQAFNLVDSLEK